MAAYQISYRNEDNELLTSETVFMRSLQWLNQVQPARHLI